MHTVNLDENKLYIRGNDGRYVPFVGITEIKEIRQNPVEIQPPVTYDKLAFNTDISFTMTLTKPMRKGQIDILCGITWTSAARRYIRLGKRHKEKERRRKLKHEAGIRSDVR